MMRTLILFSALCLITIDVCAQQAKKDIKPKTHTEQKKVEEGQMKTYYLVFLKKGPNRTQDSITSAKIQSGHMAHLMKMYEEGKMDLAGPMMNDGDIRGICVYNVGSMEEAKKLAESDPAVTSGRLIVEILPWYSQKGAMLR